MSTNCMTNTEDRRKEWQCYELLHGGEGPRGRDVLVMTPYYAPDAFAAEEAARYFEEIDMRDQAYGFTEADGSEHWIEVEGHGVYRVTCHAELSFCATKVPEKP